jgi:hypothetical protein
MVMTYEPAKLPPQTPAVKSHPEKHARQAADSEPHGDPFEYWRGTQVWADLRASFQHFATEDIELLIANRHRLVSNTYDDGQGGRCLFGWLSALHTEPIDCRHALTRYFTGSSGYPACEEPVYQPPRWLVRLIDGDICERVRARYPGITKLPWDVVVECAREYLAKRR